MVCHGPDCVIGALFVWALLVGASLKTHENQQGEHDPGYLDNFPHSWCIYSSPSSLILGEFLPKPNQIPIFPP